MIIDPKKFIINRHERQDSKQRATTVLLFLLFWGFLLYLVRPIVLVVGWGISYYIFDSVAHNMDKAEFFDTVFTRYVPIIILMTLSFWGWAAYNRFRFRGKRDKRRERKAESTTIEDVAQTCPLSVDEISSARQAYGVVFYFDDHGQIKTIDCCDSFQTFAHTVKEAAKRGGHAPLRLPKLASNQITLKEAATGPVIPLAADDDSIKDREANVDLKSLQSLEAAPQVVSTLINMQGLSQESYDYAVEKEAEQVGKEQAEAGAPNLPVQDDPIINEPSATNAEELFASSASELDDDLNLIPGMNLEESLESLDFAVQSIKKISL